MDIEESSETLGFYDYFKRQNDKSYLQMYTRLLS